jgi:hypothetical protein
MNQESQVSEFEEVDELFAEAERRFAKAQYYQALIAHDNFEGDSSPHAREVSEEIRKFSRERLAVLLGLQAENSFGLTPEEVTKLKAILRNTPVADTTEDAPSLGVQPRRRLTAKPNFKKPPRVESPTVSLPEVQRGETVTVKPSRGVVGTPNPGTRGDNFTGESTSPVSPAVNQLKPQETFEVHGENGVSVTYTKTEENFSGRPIFRGPSGNKFIMATNPAGGTYMKSVNPPVKPIGITPLPAPNENAMASIAATHLRAARKADPIASNITEE